MTKVSDASPPAFYCPRCGSPWYWVTYGTPLGCECGAILRFVRMEPGGWFANYTAINVTPVIQPREFEVPDAPR